MFHFKYRHCQSEGLKDCILDEENVWYIVSVQIGFANAFKLITSKFEKIVKYRMFETSFCSICIHCSEKLQLS